MWTSEYHSGVVQLEYLAELDSRNAMSFHVWDMIEFKCLGF